MTLAQRTPVTLRQRAESALVPGWKGKRYGLCTDSQWHLILEILLNGIVDTLCCADVQLVDEIKGKEDSPMCEECMKLHGLHK